MLLQNGCCLSSKLNALRGQSRILFSVVQWALTLGMQTPYLLGSRCLQRSGKLFCCFPQTSPFPGWPSLLILP